MVPSTSTEAIPTRSLIHSAVKLSVQPRKIVVSQAPMISCHWSSGYRFRIWPTFWKNTATEQPRERIVLHFLVKSLMRQQLGNSSRTKRTLVGKQPPSLKLSAYRINLINRKLKNRELRNSNVLSWSDTMQKYAHFCLPGSSRSISLKEVILRTSFACMTWSLLPKPMITLDRTVSLDCKNKA